SQNRRNSMSVTASHVATQPPATARARGGGYFWLGLFACLLGLVLTVIQFSVKVLGVPWYAPALATLGVFLLLVSRGRRRAIPRGVALVLVAALAGFEWYALAVLMKLPAYEGPAQAGKQLPAFSTTLADGRTFTDADLRDGSRRVMTFFRGRW